MGRVSRVIELSCAWAHLAAGDTKINHDCFRLSVYRDGERVRLITRGVAWAFTFAAAANSLLEDKS
jgi:hypothetical protein